MTGRSDRSRRVLLVAKGLDIGGVERMVVSLAVGLRERGDDIEVAVVNSGRRQLEPELVAAGVPVHWLRGTDHIGVRGALALAGMAGSKRFDIVHVHGPLPASWIRLIPGSAAIVTTAHTPIGALRRATRWAWIATARRDAATVAVSAVVASSCPGDPVVIPHAVSASVASAAIEQHSVTERHDVEAIAVASHRTAKNYPNLLRAVQMARSAGVPLRLVAVGEGPEFGHNSIVVRHLGLGEVVEFVPPSADVLGRIAAADLLVVSSDYEGQPLVVAEALAVGTPVVATDVGHVAELVGNDVGRVVPTGDPGALAVALIELASNRSLRERLGAAAVRQSARWTLEHVLDAHVELYEQLRN